MDGSNWSISSGLDGGDDDIYDIYYTVMILYCNERYCTVIYCINTVYLSFA